MNRRIALFLMLLAVGAGCAPTSSVSVPTSMASSTTPSLPALTPTSTTVVTTSTVTAAEAPVPDPTDPHGEARFAMVEIQIESRGVADPAVLDAMRAVPRHQFVAADLLGVAYGDHALPLSHGQTISQPFIVAWMSELLEVEPGDKVLEIGTGSGYQAAVLAEMGVEVYTVEIIPELAAEATARLGRLGYEDVATLQADGYFGWEEHAPYDAIIVTAAPDHLPQPLLLQLAEGGHLVIPVGPVGAVQTMWRFTQTEGDEVLAENLGSVLFVPLTREDFAE